MESDTVMTALVIALFMMVYLSAQEGLYGTYQGTLDYTGSESLDPTMPLPEEELSLPSTALVPIHGFEYYLVTDGNVRVRLWEGTDSIYLRPEFDGKRVRVLGRIVEDYGSYARGKGLPITSADPEGRVLLVSGISVVQ